MTNKEIDDLIREVLVFINDRISVHYPVATTNTFEHLNGLFTMTNCVEELLDVGWGIGKANETPTI